MDKSKTSPLVSILTSCYNGSKFIEQYKNCLLSQTYRPIECIIINDGSEDDSGPLLDNLAEKANQLGIHTRTIHQQNTGNALAISRAYGISTGEYITCWDIDDIFFPENISILVDTLENSTNCTAAHANGYYVNENDKLVNLYTFAEKHPKYNGQNLFEHLLMGTAWNWSGSYMVKSSILEDTYGTRMIPVPKSWKNSQNLQLLLPASYKESVYNDTPVMKYVLRNGSVSHEQVSYKKDLERITTYEEIRFQLLEIMNISYLKYKVNIKISFDRIKMHTAFRYGEKDDFLFFYNSIKNNKGLSSEDILLKSKICNENKLKQFVCKCIHKINILFFS